MVLFGEATVADTWEYDGTNWHETTPAASPPARIIPGITYDSFRNRIVMFGGGIGTTPWPGTWEYDGTYWYETTPAVSPPARWSGAIVYHPLRRWILAFSGRILGGDTILDTWMYHQNSFWPDETCDNGQDDDFDGAIDCADLDCEGLPCATGVCSGGVCL